MANSQNNWGRKKKKLYIIIIILEKYPAQSHRQDGRAVGSNVCKKRDPQRTQWLKRVNEDIWIRWSNTRRPSHSPLSFCVGCVTITFDHLENLKAGLISTKILHSAMRSSFNLGGNKRKNGNPTQQMEMIETLSHGNLLLLPAIHKVLILKWK